MAGISYMTRLARLGLGVGAFAGISRRVAPGEGGKPWGGKYGWDLLWF